MKVRKRVVGLLLAVILCPPLLLYFWRLLSMALRI